MHAREDIGICGLARFLAIAILMCGTTVSAQVIISVPYGTYTESAHIYKPEPPVSYYGEDLFAPDTVDKTVLKILGDSVHAYLLKMQAKTIGEGPECHATLVTKAIEPSDGQYGTWSNSSATVNAYTDFDFVIHNKTGTDVEYIVPLIVEGTLWTTVGYEEHGTHPYYETNVVASAYIGFYECPNDWDDTPIGSVALSLSHNDLPGEDPPPAVPKKKPWLLTVPIRLGKDPGDRACFTVLSQAIASGSATAYSNSYHPELNSHSNIVADAVVDPYIYIDPTWEHADKFGLTFPDNVTPLTDPPRLLFFDSFESGDTLIWSGTVP
jgi:hypothetical protein